MRVFWNRIVRVVRMSICLTAVGLSASAGLAQAGRVRIKRQSIRVDIQGLVATTTVENVYVNDGGRLAEATYDFVLPASAGVHGLAMWIDNVRCPAVVYPRATARRIYREIVTRRRDPAILEYLGEGRWHLRVFPIPISGSQKVQIVFSHVLPVRDGRVVYEYPKVTRSAPVGELDFSVDIRCPGGVGDVISQSHGLGVERLRDGKVRAGFRRGDEERPVPISFAFVPNARPPRLVGPAGKDGRAAFLADVPWPDLLGDRKISRNVVFVLDTSASMTDRAMRWLRTVVERTLKTLGGEDRFAVVAAGTDVLSWRGGELVKADPAAVEAAKKHVRGLKPSGGTDLAAALRAAEACNTDKARPLWIVVLTDGADLVGAKGFSGRAVARRLARRPVLPGKNVRLNWLFLSRGHGPSDIAATVGGKRWYVEHDAALKAATDEFLADLAEPPTEDIRIAVTADKDVRLGDVALSPPVAGGAVCLAGRYAKGGTITVTVSARVDGQPSRAQSHVTLPDPPAAAAEAWASPAFAKIVAHWRCDWLWQRLQQPGVGVRILQKLVTLSRDARIVTRATAFLILEDEDAYVKRGIAPPGQKPRARGGDKLIAADVRRVAELKKRAEALRAKGKHAEAADRLTEVTAIDPRDFATSLSAAILREFVAVGESARLARMRHAYRRGDHRGPWEEVFQPIGVMGLVPVGGDARPVRRAPPLPTDAMNAVTKARLRTKVSKFEFKNAELKDVVEFFRDAADINMQVRWAALGLMGIDKSTPVNVRLKGVSLAKALRVILEDLGGSCTYVIDDDVLMITTREETEHRTVTLVYDVRDLLPLDRDGRGLLQLRRTRTRPREGTGFFDAGSGSTVQSGAGGGETVRMGHVAMPATGAPVGTEEGGSPRVFDVADIVTRVPSFRRERQSRDGEGEWRAIDSGWPRTRRGGLERTTDIIRNLIDPVSWRTAGGEVGSIRELYGLLIVTQTMVNHESLSNLIRQIRAARPSVPGQIDPFGPAARDEPLFTSEAKITPWVLDLLKRAADGKLSRFSSVVVRKVGKRKLARIGGVWFDTALTAKSKVTLIRRGSAAARAIRSAGPDVKPAMALGRVVVLAADETRAFSLDDAGISDAYSEELKGLITATKKLPPKP